MHLLKINIEYCFKQSARQQVVRSVNQTMVLTYFEIGKRIVEEEQK